MTRRPVNQVSPSVHLRSHEAKVRGPVFVEIISRWIRSLHGSYLVREEDLEAVAAPVLNHRILTNFAAQSEGLSTRTIVERLYEEVSESANR